VSLANPPFNHRLDYLGSLSDEQLYALYSHRRGESWEPKLEWPDASGPTEAEAFASACFYNGIFEPERVAKLWAEERARRAAAR